MDTARAGDGARRILGFLRPDDRLAMTGRCQGCARRAPSSARPGDPGAGQASAPPPGSPKPFAAGAEISYLVPGRPTMPSVGRRDPGPPGPVGQDETMPDSDHAQTDALPGGAERPRKIIDRKSTR